MELCAGAAKLSSVSRRFREFVELHAQLSKFRHAFAIPDVPPKKFFGRTNPDFVLRRQRELQAFLDKLVNSIVANPPAEAAWRLLCLFLALDPKQYVPESILNLADQSAGTRREDDSAAGANNGAGNASSNGAGGPGNPGSRGANAGSANNGAGGAGAGGDDGEDADAASLEAEEMRRMDRIVDAFARQTINVSRNTEERLQHAPATLVDRIPVKALQETLQKYVLDAPLKMSRRGEDEVAEDGESTNAGEEGVANEAEESEQTEIAPIQGAEEVVVHLEMTTE